MREQRRREVEDLCREAGLALTVQRRVILAELLGREDHPTADEIYEAVAPRIAGLSRTTVYRVLDAFVGLGVARKVFHVGAVARFDPRTERHHHLVCDACGTLADLPAEEVPGVTLPQRTTSGFRITDYSINFTGLCSRCRKGTREVRKEKN